MSLAVCVSTKGYGIGKVIIRKIKGRNGIPKIRRDGRHIWNYSETKTQKECKTKKIMATTKK